MNNRLRFGIATIAVVCLFCILPATQAASASGYSTIYTISVSDDGSAHWQIEYRTPLPADEDLAGFENYSRDINTIYLPELHDLMQRSAQDAALGTSRDMAVNDFTGNAVVQTSPSGRYGVVTYTFDWTNFAKINDGISVGDAFVGGMFLARDDTLVIRYPQGYTVTSVSPAPDQTAEGLIWYGLRSFGPGQPSVILERSPSTLLPVMGGLLVLIILVITGIILYRRKTAVIRPDEEVAELPDSDDTGVPLSKSDLETLEEKIIQLLVSRNGEEFQSELVKVLGLPKSTVSTTLNDLHQRGIIQKVRKGRENLIRLVKVQE